MFMRYIPVASIIYFRKGALYYLKDLSITLGLCIVRMHTANHNACTHAGKKQSHIRPNLCVGEEKNPKAISSAIGKLQQ